MNQKDVNRKLSCIFSTDVVGYSRLMEENEASTVKHLEENKKLISKLIEEYHGRVVDSPGDNLLAEFSSAVKAVDCAVNVQEELKTRNAELSDSRKMEFRIGINLGDVIEENGNLYGSGVNIAARLEGLAQPGEIYISRNVFDQVKTNLDLGYEYLGEHNVKNLTEPVRVYKVLTGDDCIGKIIGEKKVNGTTSHKIFGIQEFSGNKRVLFYSTIIILFFITGAVLFYQPWNPKDSIGKLPSRKHLAILPFQPEKLTGESIAFAKGIARSISSQLSKVADQNSLQVICPSEFREKNINTVQEAIREFGVNLVIEGVLQISGEDLLLSYYIVDAKTKNLLAGDTIPASTSNSIELMKMLFASLLKNLEIDPLSEEKNSIATHGTKSPEANNYYLHAVGFLQNYQKSENVQTAISLLEDALKRDPEYADAYAALGEARWRLYGYEKETKLIEEAQSACNSALELDRDLVSGHVCLGIVSTGKGKYEEAVEEFKRALELEPRCDEAWRGLGSAYKKLNNFKEAEETYKQAIKVKPNYWAGYGELGALYIDRGRFPEAEEQFSEVTKLVPDHQFGHNNLGAVYLYEGRYTEAILKLQHSNTLRETETAYSNLGTAYFFLKRYSDAAAAYEKAIGLNKKDWMIWGNLGEARYWDPASRARAEDAYREALTLAKKKLQVNDRDKKLLTFMAYYHAMLDERKDAENYLTQVLAMDPQHPEILLYLAQIFYLLGDTDQTLGWLKKALASGLAKENINNNPLFITVRDSREFKDMLQNY